MAFSASACLNAFWQNARRLDRASEGDHEKAARKILLPARKALRLRRIRQEPEGKPRLAHIRHSGPAATHTSATTGEEAAAAEGCVIGPRCDQTRRFTPAGLKEVFNRLQLRLWQSRIS